MTMNLGTAVFDSSIDLSGIRRGINDIQKLLQRKENAVAVRVVIDPASLQTVKDTILGALAGGPSGNGGLGAQLGASIAAGMSRGVSKGLADVGKEAVRQQGQIDRARVASEAAAAAQIRQIRAAAAADDRRIRAQEEADQRKANLMQLQASQQGALNRQRANLQRENDDRKAAARREEQDRNEARREAAAAARKEEAAKKAEQREGERFVANVRRMNAQHARLIANEERMMQRDAENEQKRQRREEAAENARAARAARAREKETAAAVAAAAKEAAALAEAKNRAIRSLGSIASGLGQQGTGAAFKLIGTDAGKKFLEGIGSYQGAVGAIFNKLGQSGSSALIAGLAQASPGVRNVLSALGSQGGQTLLQNLTSGLQNGGLLSGIKNVFGGLFSGIGTSGGASVLSGVKGALMGAGAGGIAASIAASLGGALLKAGGTAAISFMKTFSEGVINLSKALFEKVADMAGRAVKGSLSQIDKSVDVAGSIDTDSKTAALISGQQRNARLGKVGANLGDAQIQAQFRQQALALGADSSLIVTPGEVAEAQKALAVGGQSSEFIKSSLKDIIMMSNVLKQDLKSTVADVLDITSATDFKKGKNGQEVDDKTAELAASNAVKQIFGSVTTGRVKLADLAQTVKYSRFGDGTAQSLQDQLVLSSLNTQAGFRGSTAGTGASAFFENMDRLVNLPIFQDIKNADGTRGIKLDNADGTQKTQVALLQEITKAYNEIRQNPSKFKTGNITDGEFDRRFQSEVSKALDKRGFNYLTKMASLDINKGPEDSKDLRLANDFVNNNSGLFDKLKDIPTESVGSGKRLLTGSIESVQGSIGFALNKPVDQFYKSLGKGIENVFGGIKSLKDLKESETALAKEKDNLASMSADLKSLEGRTDDASKQKRNSLKDAIKQSESLIETLTIAQLKTKKLDQNSIETIEALRKNSEIALNKKEDDLNEERARINAEIKTAKESNDKDKETKVLLLQQELTALDDKKKALDDKRQEEKIKFDRLLDKELADKNFKTFQAWERLTGEGGVIQKLTDYLQGAGLSLGDGIQSLFTEIVSTTGNLIKLFTDKEFSKDLSSVVGLGKSVINLGFELFKVGFKLVATAAPILSEFIKGATSIIGSISQKISEFRVGGGDDKDSGLVGGAKVALRNNTTSQTAQAAQQTTPGIMASIVQGFMGGLGGGGGQLLRDNGANLQLLASQLLQTVVSIASFVGQIVGLVLRVSSVLLNVVLPPINWLLGAFNTILSLVEGIVRIVSSTFGGLLELVGGATFKIFDVTFGNLNKANTKLVSDINVLSSAGSAAITDLFSRSHNALADWSDNLNSQIMPSIKGGFDGLWGHIKSGMTGVGDFWNGINWGGMWKSFGDGFNSIKNGIMAFFFGGGGDQGVLVASDPGVVSDSSGILAGAESGGGGGGSLADRIGQSIFSTLTKIPGWIIQYLSSPFTTATTLMNTDWGAVYTTMVNGIETLGVNYLTWLGSKYTETMNWWNQESTRWSDATRALFDWIGNAVLSWVSSRYTETMNWWNQESTRWSDATRALFDWIGNAVLSWVSSRYTETMNWWNQETTRWSDATRAILGYIGNVSLPWLQNVGLGVIEFLKTSMQKAGDFVKNIFGEMGAALKAKFEGPIQWISEKLQGVVEAAKGALDMLNGGGGGGGGVGGSASSPDQYVGGVLSILESGSRQGRVDVAQVIANRVGTNFGGFGASIRDQAFASGQFQPFFAETYGIKKNDIQDYNSAIAALKKAGYSEGKAKEALDNFFADVRNAAMVKDSADKIGGRAYFKGVSERKNMRGDDFLRSTAGTENFFHHEDSDTANRKLGNLQKLFEQSNAVGQLGNALNANFNNAANAVNTAGYKLWSTGGGSYEHAAGNKLRPHHNMSGAYTTLADGSRTTSRGTAYDMTLENASGNTTVPVPAPMSGTVVHTGPMGGYGNVVQIKDSSGTLAHIAHLSSISVRKGQTISEGVAVGIQGGTGSSLRNDDLPIHVHLETTPAIAQRYADRIAKNAYGKSGGGGGTKPTDLGSFQMVPATIPEATPAAKVIGGGGAKTASTLSSALLDSLDSADLSTTKATVKTVTTSIRKNGLSNGLLKDIFNTDTLAALVNKLTNGKLDELKNIDPSLLKDGILAFVKDKVGTIAPNFKNIDWANVKSDIMDKLKGYGIEDMLDSLDEAKLDDEPAKPITPPTTIFKPKPLPTEKSITDILNSIYKNNNGSFDVRGLSFGFVDANGNLPSSFGTSNVAKSLADALKGYSANAPLDKFANEKKARDKAIQDIQDKLSGNRKEDLLGDAKAKVAKLEQALIDAKKKQAIANESVNLSQEEFANKNKQRVASIDAQLIRDRKQLEDLYARYGGKANADAQNAKFKTIKDKLLANLAASNDPIKKEAIIKEGIASLKGSKDEISFRRLLLLEAAEREIVDITKRERGLDKDTKIQAARDKQIARFGTYLTGLDRSIAEKEFAIKQLETSKANLSTNSAINKKQLDIATQNKKTAADKAVTDAEAAIKAAKKDLKDLQIKQDLQRQLEKLQKEAQEKEANIGDARFKQIDAYLRSKGYDPTYEDVLKIYLRSKQIEQTEGMVPSKLDENVRKALFEAGLFGVGAQVFNAGKSIEFPTNSVYDVMNSSGIYRSLGGMQYGTIGINSNMRTNAILDITGGATVGVDNTVPRNRSGGGGNKTIRFQFDGIDENQLVSSGQIKQLQNYINDPAFMDDMMDVIVDRLRYDSRLRQELGLR